MIFGLHISHFKDLFKEIKSYHDRLGVNCFQFFLSSPRRGDLQVSKKNINQMDKIKKYVTKNNIYLFTHTSYIYNFALHPRLGVPSYPTSGVPKTSYWIKSLIKELEYADQMGIKGCVLHLGKAVRDMSEKTGFDNMRKSIKMVINSTPNISAKILLETSSGQGTELGYDLKKFSKFYHSFSTKYRKRLGICVDTCHVFSAGYDLRTKTNVKNFFILLHKLFDLKNIKLIHFNDSATLFKSRVDRHELVNKGTINKGLLYVSKFANKYKIPLVFETPRSNFKKDLEIIKIT